MKYSAAGCHIYFLQSASALLSQFFEERDDEHK